MEIIHIAFYPGSAADAETDSSLVHQHNEFVLVFQLYSFKPTKLISLPV